MKTSLLLTGFLLFIIEVNGQIGIHTVYSPYLLNSGEKSSALKNNKGLANNRLDSVFVKDLPLFSKYIPKRKYVRTIIFADNGFAIASLNTGKLGNEIDLERSKNRTKQLFFKMKMWRYFRE